MSRLNELIEQAKKVDIHELDEALSFAHRAKGALLEMDKGPKFIMTEDDCFYMTEENFGDFNDAASCVLEEEMLQLEILAFLVNNPRLYHQGKMWGFNDTEVRGDICKKLREAA